MSEWSAGAGYVTTREESLRADGGDGLFELFPDPAVQYTAAEPPTVRRTNPAFRATFGDEADADDPLADTLDATAGDGDWTTDVIEAVRTGETVAIEGACTAGEESWPVNVRVLPADNSGGYVLYTDRGTDDGTREEGEKLEEFASIVSHDLRNPLEVASIHLEAAQRSGDQQHFEKVAKMHNRIEDIIEDVLQLTRGSGEVDTSQAVDLETVVDEAWESVQTDDRTLTVEGSLRLYADSNRLQTILENLFRNAVEHAGPGTAITVGVLDGEGFYVADDGPGIPEAERERVLKPGVSETDDGTGLGLAIVRRIASAHGWEFALTESEAGGARFEFSGVETAE